MEGCDFYKVEGNQRAPWGPFYIKPLFPSMRTPPSTSNHLLKVSPLNAITLGILMLHYRNFKDTNILSIIFPLKKSIYSERKYLQELSKLNNKEIIKPNLKCVNINK